MCQKEKRRGQKVGKEGLKEEKGEIKGKGWEGVLSDSEFSFRL